MLAEKQRKGKSFVVFLTRASRNQTRISCHQDTEKDQKGTWCLSVFVVSFLAGCTSIFSARYHQSISGEQFAG
jgi:hypothetical protein